MNDIDLTNKWLQKANNDLISAKHLFEDLHPKQIDISCFHAQQAAEKALKGFLYYKGLEPPKSHNLLLLCQKCSEIDISFSAIMDACIMLTPYGVITRYPNDLEITECDTSIAIRKATEIYNFAVAKINKL